MTSKELMIGDWVYNKHFNGEIEPIQIHNIYGTEVNCKTERNCFDVDEIVSGTYMSDLQPIPLSPEILEKNFNSKELPDDPYGAYFFGGNDYIEVYIKEYTDGLWQVSVDEVSMYVLPSWRMFVSNVHELQHALRLCGINKEIEI